MSEQETPLGLTKWQLGLLVGVPVTVVAVAGVWWYLNTSDDDDDESQDEESGKTAEINTPKAKEPKEEVDNMVSDG